MRRLTPRFLEKVWGSTRLGPWFPDSDRKIGEVWFEGVADLPLLIKFIFTTEKLSVQVHPGDEYARLHHGSRGKTEMWRVLAAEPGAKVAAGFREPLTAEQLREAALSGSIEEKLEWFDAKPGDTFFIPAGTVHAIGPGLAMCEIQQNSDITYRLYDYGRPRELHLDHGVAVSRLECWDPRRAAEVACEYFSTSLVRGGVRLPGDFEFLIAIEGSGTVGGEPVRGGEVWYGREAVEIGGDVTLLAVGPPFLAARRLWPPSTG
jgi:mannose-6-phosphate isomerase